MEAEEYENMNTCDTCKWWAPDGTPYPNGHHLCLHAKVDMPDGDAVDGLDSRADYDYGVTTGPQFGCIHHAEK